MLSKIILCGLSVFVVTEAALKVLEGYTGTGKSYISSHLGCPSPTCSGERSCTSVGIMCTLNAMSIFDGVGLDEDREHVVEYMGNSIKMTGTPYAMYDLFNKLEEKKVSEVELYIVHDANNVRESGSVKEYLNFVTNVLHCPVTRVLNKFRESNPDHVLRRRPGDITIAEGQTSNIQLNGASCAFGLSPNWRDLIVNNHLTSVKSLTQVRNCQDLAQLKKNLRDNADWHRHAEGADNRDCQYWGETGGRYCKGFKAFGKCSNWEPNRGWKTNDECVRQRNQANHDINTRNAQLQQWKDASHAALAEIDRGIAACKALPNYHHIEL